MSERSFVSIPESEHSALIHRAVSAQKDAELAAQNTFDVTGALRDKVNNDRWADPSRVNQGGVARLMEGSSGYGSDKWGFAGLDEDGYYDKLNESQTGEPEYTDYYGIVPLWDMNKATGATALVPGSHRLVHQINAFRKTRKAADGKYIGPFVNESADIECFTA